MPLPITLRTLLFLLALVAFCGTTAAALAASREPASGETRTVSVAGFHKLRVDGDAVVMLVAGTTETLTVSVPERQRKDIRIEIDEDGLLRIRTRYEHGWWDHLFFGAPRKTPRLTLVYRNLDSIELTGAVKLVGTDLRSPRLDIAVSGAASLQLAGVQTDALRLDGSGAVKARLAGHATSQQIIISGAGKYDAPTLVSDEARVQVAGAGKVIVQANRTLDVNLSGAAKVEYLGDPRVIQHISGAGKVQRRRMAQSPSTSG